MNAVCLEDGTSSQTDSRRCPIAESCGSLKPGYLSQPHPDIGEGIVERKVCFGDADQCCSSSREVLVKNCGTHFVYRLYPTTTYEKYCVEESTTTMCNANAYDEIDDDWRGETVAYDNADRHDDTPGNWIRFTNYLGRMPEYSMSIIYIQLWTLLSWLPQRSSSHQSGMYSQLQHLLVHVYD